GRALELAALRPEPHRAAEIGVRAALLHAPALVLPFGDQRDHGIRRRAVDLRRLRVLQAEHVPRILDDRDLHAEADAEVRDALLACEAHRLDLPFDAALAEAARDEDRIRLR